MKCSHIGHEMSHFVRGKLHRRGTTSPSPWGVKGAGMDKSSPTPTNALTRTSFIPQVGQNSGEQSNGQVMSRSAVQTQSSQNQEIFLGTFFGGLGQTDDSPAAVHNGVSIIVANA